MPVTYLYVIRGSITCFTFSPIHLGALKIRSSDGRERMAVRSRELRKISWPLTNPSDTCDPYCVSRTPNVGVSWISCQRNAVVTCGATSSRSTNWRVSNPGWLRCRNPALESKLHQMGKLFH